MLTRIKPIGMAVIVLTPCLLEGSPAGLYIKSAGTFDTTDHVVAAINVAYQFNRGRLLELGCTAWPLSMACSDFKHVPKLTMLDKHILPLNDQYNVYLQWGVTLQSTLSDYDPLVGCGIAYHISRTWHVDLSLRHYTLLSFLRANAIPLTNNTMTIGVGYYLN